MTTDHPPYTISNFIVAKCPDFAGTAVADTGFEKGGSRKGSASAKCDPIFSHAPFWVIIYGIKWQSISTYSYYLYSNSL